jgi:hypothetical protein
MDAASRVRLACVAVATVSGVLLSAQAPAPTAPVRGVQIRNPFTDIE